MLIGDIRNFIKSEGSVTITDLTINFDMEYEEIEASLEVLLNKNYIEKTLPTPDLGSPAKCKGCSMGCKPKEQENCSPAPSFTIYKWCK